MADHKHINNRAFFQFMINIGKWASLSCILKPRQIDDVNRELLAEPVTAPLLPKLKMLLTTTNLIRAFFLVVLILFAPTFPWPESLKFGLLLTLLVCFPCHERSTRLHNRGQAISATIKLKQVVNITNLRKVVFWGAALVYAISFPPWNDSVAVAVTFFTLLVAASSSVYIQFSIQSNSNEVKE